MANLNAAGIQMAYGAIAQAWEDSSPLLVIAEGVGQGGSRHTHYDMAEAFKSVTKWVGKVDRADLIPDYVRRAFTQLRSGRPGPVLLIVPRDLGEYDDDEHPVRAGEGLADAAPIPTTSRPPIKALLAAKDPLLYVGEGVYYADATSELLQFAELAQVPVLTTLKGKGTFPENHPLSVGVRGSLAEHFLRKADLLFSIGSSLFPNRFSHAIPDADRRPSCSARSTRSTSTAATRRPRGDRRRQAHPAGPQRGAAQARGRAKKPALVEEIRTAKQAFIAKFRPWMESSETPINPYRVIGDLIKVLDPKSSFVTADSGNTRDQTSTVYEAHIPRGHLGWGNVSTLGFSLAGAVAAKLAYPNRQCVLVTGDAGVCYMMGNFEAVARYKIGVTILHINNGGYSGYGPGFWGGGHDPYTWKVSDHASACMANMAQAVGFHAEDVSAPGEIIPALKRALDENAKGRPAFIEFMASHHPVTVAGSVRRRSGRR